MLIAEPATFAFSTIIATHCSRSTRTEKGAERSSILPASIFEKSSTSSTSAASRLAQLLIESTRCLWRLSREVSSNAMARPRIPEIGFRISWLMFARNSDFASFAFSSCAVFFWTRISRRAFWRFRNASLHLNDPKTPPARIATKRMMAGAVRYQGGRTVKLQLVAGPTIPASFTTRTDSW